MAVKSEVDNLTPFTKTSINPIAYPNDGVNTVLPATDIKVSIFLPEVPALPELPELPEVPEEPEVPLVIPLVAVTIPLLATNTPFSFLILTSPVKNPCWLILL